MITKKKTCFEENDRNANRVIKMGSKDADAIQTTLDVQCSIYIISVLQEQNPLELSAHAGHDMLPQIFKISV